ncbi:hypothetical protein SAMN05421821_105120 [Mucilaginibacter lappiensis]|uniref:Lipoprotein n=1 Tax=Mucilaginibacter lappiensis TaxID=354630 RepID=A0ABR6PJ92_9SPHI|nr:hypothetical protein [Mucilaginibacter lappiensis]MBB6109701.1 hypothetical protein [Mucilaginibacter lappiensis]SIR12364.1 hypothetical protein SAMN05421821_105120 [Mucilaginibacter lappiensis]
MKKLLIIAFIAIFLSGCAEKTHLLDSSKASKSEKKSVDSTGSQNLKLVDKSVITIERTADTSVTVTGKAVTGEIDTGLAGDSGIVNQHFENGDVDLDLSFNKNTGKISATAKPKPKKIPFKYHERLTTRYDITKTDNSKSKVKSSLELKSDTTQKRVSDHRGPVKSLGTIKWLIIWLILAITFVAVLALGIKRYFKI